MEGPHRFSIVLASGVFNSVLSSRTSVVTNSVNVLTSTDLSNDGLNLCRPVRNSTPSVTNRGVTGPLTAVLSITVVLHCSLSRDRTTSTVRTTITGILRACHAPSVCRRNFAGINYSRVNSHIYRTLWLIGNVRLFSVRSRVLPNVSSNTGAIRSDLRLLSYLGGRKMAGIYLAPRFCAGRVDLRSFVTRETRGFRGFGPRVPGNVGVILKARICIAGCLFGGRGVGNVGCKGSGCVLARFPCGTAFSSGSCRVLSELVDRRKLVPMVPRIRHCDFLISGPSIVRSLGQLNIIVRAGVSGCAGGTPVVGHHEVLGLMDTKLVSVVNASTRSFGRGAPRLCSSTVRYVTGGYNQRTISELVGGDRGVFGTTVN